MSNAYVTLWTKARCAWLRRVRDSGRCSFSLTVRIYPCPRAHVSVGDIVFPVWVSHGQLRIIARMQVGRIISLAEYASKYVGLGPLPAGPVDHDFPRLHPSLAIARHLAAVIKLPSPRWEPTLISSGALLPRSYHCSDSVTRQVGKRHSPVCKTGACRAA